MRKAPKNAHSDTARYFTTLRIGRATEESNWDTCHRHHLSLQKQAIALNHIATGCSTLGDYPKGIQMFYGSLKISECLHAGSGQEIP